MNRAQPDDVPFFDPCDGGIEARALFLLEAPGRRAKGSGFVSRNNPDETAKNTFELQREAGLPRRSVVLWNIVPWYVGSGGKIRGVSWSDIKQAQGYLDRLLGLLPGLEAIVLVGRKAQGARARIEQHGVRVFESPHPSPIALGTRRETRGEILKSWSEVATFINADP